MSANARVVHLAERASYTGNVCRTAWDSITWPSGPDPLTEELSKVTCLKCRARMIADGKCPECGSFRLAWDHSRAVRPDVSPGRYVANDVTTVFHLGCLECSETLISGIGPDRLAAFLTDMRFRP